MFYAKFKELCLEKNISVNKVAIDLGLNKSTPTKWKQKGACPDGITLSKIANYFDVSVNFLLDLPPFDSWDLINADRTNFMNYVNIDSETLKNVWDIDENTVDSISYTKFILFLSTAIKKAVLNYDGSWKVILRSCFRPCKKNRNSELPAVMYLFNDLSYDKQQEVIAFLEFKLAQQKIKPDDNYIGQAAAFGSGPMGVPANKEASQKLAALAKKKRDEKRNN